MSTINTLTSSVNTSIDDLVDRVGFGDRAAFSQLHELTVRRVIGLVRQVIRDPSQSEEVAQEVFLEVWQSAARFQRTKGRALSWIFTIAHRRAIDRVRASQASRDRDLRIGVRDFPTAHDSVAEHAQTTWETARVRVAMAGLTSFQRQAIELSYFCGFTHAEVAERTGVNVGTAKTRTRDALIRLRSVLAA